MMKVAVNFMSDGNKITVSLREMEKVCVFSEVMYAALQNKHNNISLKSGEWRKELIPHAIGTAINFVSKFQG